MPILFKNDRETGWCFNKWTRWPLQKSWSWSCLEMIVRRAPTGTVFRSLNAMRNCDPAFIVKNAGRCRVYTAPSINLSQGWNVSRILSPPDGGWWSFIWEIRRRIPRCDLPGSPFARANQTGNLQGRLIWSCSVWGLPCLQCHHWSGALLPHLFTLIYLTVDGIFSVALSLGLLPVLVKNHTALRSSDFPLPALFLRSDHPSSPGLVLYPTTVGDNSQ